ncbi:MAG: exodeoxyribonuclease VII small subunit [Clostridiales bacterium]|nr:exodeoxyribonuclease VII small subunit [Clostridiales bacterium]
MNFEQNFKKIQDILLKLESGQASLEESVGLFEEGIILTKQCQDYLDNYKGKFEVIKEELEK